MKIQTILFNILVAMTFVSCASLLKSTRFTPQHDHTDPELAPYVNRWLQTAADQGIRFKNRVEVGFENINEGLVVGMCYYASYFREIGVNKKYWDALSDTSRWTIISHELTHCYCGRDHDYGKNKEYEDPQKDRRVSEKTDGFFKDGCPKSIMFPEVVEDSCAISHFSEYQKEMLERCDPY